MEFLQRAGKGGSPADYRAEGSLGVSSLRNQNVEEDVSSRYRGTVFLAPDELMP